MHLIGCLKLHNFLIGLETTDLAEDINVKQGKSSFKKCFFLAQNIFKRFSNIDIAEILSNEFRKFLFTLNPIPCRS